ncbi:MAG: GlsB/YeaQ/YmgE family stress response membrane protein [Proteobacteria bacterium]|nr:GlsB/YeaQ/YmgE family stress response membrane protein [Pseudomonadota bacterium]
MLGTIIFIAIGCLAGFLAGKIMRGGGFGFILNSVLGIVGGVVGGWLLSLLNITWGGLLGQIGTAVIGAVVVLAIASLFSGKGKK